jgi:hypothetical protein
MDPNGSDAKAQYDRFNRLFREDPWILPLQPTVRIDLNSPRVDGFGDYFTLQNWEPNSARSA